MITQRITNSSADASSERILKLRAANVLPTFYPHVCQRDFCDPWSEIDCVRNGLLSPTERIIDSSVYVCRLRGIHVCTKDRCDLYVGTHDGVCPVTGLFLLFFVFCSFCKKKLLYFMSGVYHGHTNGEMAYVAPEKRTAHFKRGYSKPKARLWKRQLEEQAFDEEETQKRQRLEQLKEYSKKSTFGALFQTTQAAVVLESVKAEPTQAYEQASAASEERAKSAQQLGKKAANSQHRRKQKNRDTAESIIIQLLYSNDRKLINQQKKDQLDAQRDQVIRTYYAAREGKTFPILTEVISRFFLLFCSVLFADAWG